MYFNSQEDRLKECSFHDTLDENLSCCNAKNSQSIN